MSGCKAEGERAPGEESRDGRRSQTESGLDGKSERSDGN